MTTEELIGVWAMMAYLHNTSGHQFALDAFGPDRHPSYLAEYSELFYKSPSTAFGKLDDDHFRKIAEIVMERHGEESRRRWMSPMDRLRTFMDPK